MGKVESNWYGGMANDFEDALIKHIKPVGKKYLITFYMRNTQSL